MVEAKPETWTPEAQLVTLAGAPTTSLDQALRVLRLLDAGESFVAIERGEWLPGGETYTYTLNLITDAGAHRYVMKAPTSLGTRPSEVIERWELRRQRLLAFGVHVPDVYACADGIYLQAFIGHDLRAHACEGLGSDQLRRSLDSVLCGINRAGFRPVSLHDLRTDGVDVYVIDFGSDLGHWSQPDANESYPDMLQRLQSSLPKELLAR